MEITRARGGRQRRREAPLAEEQGGREHRQVGEATLTVQRPSWLRE